MGSFGAVEPLLSTTAGIVFLLLGAVAVFSMVEVVGSTGTQVSQRYVTIHRVAGWAFALLFLGMFVYMTARLTDYDDGDFSARDVVHFTLASALLCVLALKVSIPRRFPGLRSKLFFLGTTAYVFGFSLVLITAGYHIVKITTGNPYVWHIDSDNGLLDERLGKEFLITKCSTCHLLERLLKPRSAPAWESSVSRMVALAQPRITGAQAAQILGYLVKNHAPRTASVSAAASPLERHCLPCHEARDILVKHYALDDWKVILQAMNGYDATLVPLDQVDAIARYLVKKQAQDERAGD